MPAKKRMSAAAKDRIRRMKWWREARFGMFIHWGLYAQIGHHEWSMETEAIPLAEYEALADTWKPKPNAAREWAKLAKSMGMRYMVMTTKHHEGFCLWDTKLTDYCAPQQGPGRDLVQEYVDACRAEGLRVGFYYSLMDWHHPDGERCMKDEAARKRFVEYTHGLVRELCTNYGKIDIMWYDCDAPLDAEGWESKKLNRMVRKLQPDIIINERSGVPEDFGTPEGHVTAEDSVDGRGWEACMTMNESWGYSKIDRGSRTAQAIVFDLLEAARGGGNYLLNVGPKPDGSFPAKTLRTWKTVGEWMRKNGEQVYHADPFRMYGSRLARP